MGTRLLGKIALITGACGGVGETTARLFARQGAKVVLADSNVEGVERLTAAINESQQAAAYGVAVDLAERRDIDRMVQSSVEQFGGIDVVINMAAATNLLADDRALTDIDVDLWEGTFDVDLTAPMIISKLAIPYMIERGGGSIVYVSSAAALRAEYGLTAYSAAKLGLMSLSRSVAVQFGNVGIRSNVIVPGLTESPANRTSTDPGALDVMLQAVPLGRKGRPIEQANACMFLASDEASFVTGTVLPVDGGLTVMQAWAPGLHSRTVAGRA